MLPLLFYLLSLLFQVLLMLFWVDHCQMSDAIVSKYIFISTALFL